jgi:hypothetical protein
MKRGLMGCAVAFSMLACAGARSEGALAVGSTGNVTKEGIAFGTAINSKTREQAVATAMEYCRKYASAPKASLHCQLVGAFKRQCYAVALDPKAGTPGAGWSIAPDQATAEQRAIATCKTSAGKNRAQFCVVQKSKCDEHN